MRRLTVLNALVLLTAGPWLHAQTAAGRPATPPAQQASKPRATAPPPAPAKPPVPKRQQPERITLTVHDAEQSRRLLAGCDADADDRLDVFEARAALADFGDPTDPNWFRRLDTDRDGFLDWPEFDRFYRDTVRDGATLQLQLARALPPAREFALADTGPAPRRTIDLFDTNHDGLLAMDEVAGMLKELGVPPEAMRMAPMLDRDRDGRLSEDELAPAMRQLHIDLLAPVAGPPTGKKAGAALPTPWPQVDADSNQAIDARELAAALRRIDPQLGRWAAIVLAAADRNGDGRLGANELPAAEEAAAQAMAERSDRR